MNTKTTAKPKALRPQRKSRTDVVEQNMDPGFDAALNAQAEAEKQANERKYAQDAAEVKRRLALIDEARAHDKPAYVQMARDRAYAAGRSKFPVRVNIIGTYIDTWTSLLYARNPDIDVVPEESVTQVIPQERIDFSKTFEKVLGQLWKKARIKRSAKPWVRTALTTKMGVIKGVWIERNGADPQVSQQLKDLQDNLAQLQLRSTTLEEGIVDETDSERAQIEDQIKGLQAKAEKVISQGYVADLVDPADITVSLEAPSVMRFREGPWVSHRLYRTWRQFCAEAKITDPLIIQKLKGAASYYPVKKTDVNEAALHEYTERDVDRYVGGGIGAPTTPTSEGYLCIEEMWDATNSLVYTLVRGVDCMPVEPYTPSAVCLDFYPFHFLAFTEVDGERWPQSLNERSQSLQDDANAAISGFSEHRARIKPGMLFNEAAITAKQLQKVLKSVIGEYVGLKLIDPEMDIRKVFVEKNYPQLDPVIYALEPILQMFELVWGLQEAMTGTIDTAKTATEAEIQEGGTKSRTGDKRDTLEDRLSEMANQTGEYALQSLDRDAVVDLIGEEALWPEGLTVEQLDLMATVSIRAGSSGKPNIQAQRESWEKLAGSVATLIQTIGTLRGASSLDMADCYEELAKETFARSGERVDVSRFIPKVPDLLANPAAGAVDPETGQPVATDPAAPPGSAPPAAAGGAAPPEPGAPPPDPGHPATR
jgi:hypothetical protein